MKFTKCILTMALVTGLAAGTLSLRAADKAKPYPLAKCIVSDEKLGEHGKPYVFTESGQEVKLCCKACLKDFNKDKAKHLKKVEDAQKQKK